MRNLALVAMFITASVLTACGDDGNDSPLDPVDAAPAGPACDPLANTGCAADEKCSLVVEATDPVLLSRTACVPDGAVALGDACTTAFANAGPLAQGLGFDNCAGGAFCVRNVCTEICELDTARDIDTCPDGVKACGLYTDIFDDVTAANVGLCDPICDPFDAVSCGAEEACYLSLFTGAATCSSNQSALALGTQCTGLNSCDSGLGCILQNPQQQLSCTPYCKTGDGLTLAGESCSVALGGVGTAQCVQINRFYNNIPKVGDEFGMCVDCADPQFSMNPGCMAQTATDAVQSSPAAWRLSLDGQQSLLH